MNKVADLFLVTPPCLEVSNNTASRLCEGHYRCVRVRGPNKANQARNNRQLSARPGSPTRATAVDGHLETQRLDKRRFTAIRPDYPHGPFVRGLLGIDLDHPLLVAPVAFVGAAEGNPFSIRRPSAGRTDTGTAEGREPALADAIEVDDEQFERITDGK